MTVSLAKDTLLQNSVPRLGDDSQDRLNHRQNVPRGEELRRCRRTSALTNVHEMLPRCSARTTSASFIPAERVQKRTCAGLIR